jgi:LuxR family maltose regulon positive regulatory protein
MQPPRLVPHQAGRRAYFTMTGNSNPKRGLRAVRDHRLALLVGASGLDRTALLRRWASEGSKEEGLRIVYLGLHSEDNCPYKFFKRILQVFQDTGLKFKWDSVAQHEDPKAFSLKDALTDLINTVDSGWEDYILILDNYEVIVDHNIHTGIEFMLDFLSEKMHIMISSREELPLRLAKLRVRRQLLVLGLEDLLR